MAWLRDGEKSLKMFIRFDRTHERDRRTDTQTDRHRMQAYTALMHSIAR